MNSKKWLKIFIWLSFAGVGFVGLVNYIVDPFQQYRVKTFYPIYYSNERYQNGGFAKNFQYDSVIIGTSMTENFIISEVEKKLNFNKVLKLCASGGSAKEQSITLKTAIDNNKNLKNVLWGLDTYAFIGDPSRLGHGSGSFPYFLYDNNILNDYKYLISLDTAKDSVKAFLYQFVKNKNDPFFNYNTMYQWQHLDEKKFIFAEIKKSWHTRNKNFNTNPIEEQKFDKLKKSFDVNFLNIIKNNPQINFKIFFPPYSILTFKNTEEKKLVDDTLNFKRYVFSSLISFSNVEIYDFQIADNITQDLSNYKDLSHYHQKINIWMLNQMKNNNYLITKENMDQHLENLREQIRNYDLNQTL